VQRFTRSSLGDGVGWWDVLGLSLLAGIGFTVSLLIGELAFGAGSEKDEHARIGILAGSFISALLAAIVLRARNRHYRRLHLEEERNTDADGIPDVYQQPH
jgi:Na+:H+ antiporter, NhaA family